MKIRVYRHAECPSCARICRVLGWLNWLGRAEFSTAVPPSGPLVKGEVVVEEIGTGRVLQGYPAFQSLARAIPAYLPLRLCCAFPVVRRALARRFSAGRIREA